MIRRLWMHTAAAVGVMVAASIVAAVLLPADAEFMLHVSGRTAARREGLVIVPLMTVLFAALSTFRLRREASTSAEWPLPLVLVHFLAFVHLNVLVSGFQRSATGAGATLVVLVVAVATVLAAVRALNRARGALPRDEEGS